MIIIIQLTQLNKDDLKTVWNLAYTQDNPLWAQYDAPYFMEYRKYTYSEFVDKEGDFYANNDKLFGIFLDKHLIGYVSYYFVSRQTRWLEVGITIFKESEWNKGIGSQSLILFIDFIFKKYSEIEHIGLTTWSGNPGMMTLATKIGLLEEARIRNVRYYNNIYYDSMKYGILRDEFYLLYPQHIEIKNTDYKSS